MSSFLIGSGALLAALAFQLTGESLRSPAVAKAAAPQGMTVRSVLNAREVGYLWKLADFYEFRGKKLGARHLRPTVVELDQELVWKAAGASMQAVQHSSDLAFAENVIHFASRSGEVHLTSAYLGENYWRISKEDGSWERTQFFRVVPHFLPQAPVLKNSPAVQPGSESNLLLPLKVEATRQFAGFLLELSAEEDFARETELHWLSGPETKLEIPATSKRQAFLRIRGVTTQQELSEFSETYRIDLKPKPATHSPRKAPALL